MSYLSKIHAAINPKLEDTVNKLMADQKFLHAIPDMISASEAGIVVGHSQGKPEMIKFNSLSLAFFKAVHSKDTGAALNAADALCKAGHGEAFGLK